MKSSTKKILIIGGTGFLGHHIVKRFVKKKYSVSFLLFAALSAFITSLIGIWHSGVELEIFYLLYSQ